MRLARPALFLGFAASALFATADARAVIKLIQKESKEFRMDGPTRLRVTRELATPELRCEYAARLLERLGSPA